MKALVLNPDSFRIEEMARPVCDRERVIVKIKYAALNHRDEWIRQGKYARIEYPCVPGSDGMGEVVDVGKGVDTSWLGKDVIINPNINWGMNPAYQDMKNYQILGMPSQGTLAEFISVGADRLHEKPAFLANEEAAALPLAGLTAYNALFNKGKAEKGMNILISGVGGGVAQFAFQFAVTIGAKVWVTSSKEEVLETCVNMGAAGRVNYHRPEAYEQIRKESGGIDLIIDSAGGDGINDLMSTLKPGGKYVFFGATLGIPSGLNLRMIFWKHLSLLGTTMGSDIDFHKMIDFVEKHQIHPIVDKVFEFNEVTEAFERMHSGFHFGKIVVRVGK